jgi:mono/diheme cytochrome c family protein
MIRKKHALDLIGGVKRFSTRQTRGVCAEIMLNQEAEEAFFMPQNCWARSLIVVAFCTAALLLLRVQAASGAAPGQEAASRGHALAQAWCASCHQIEKFAVPLESRAPAFTAIAAMRSTTPLAIKVFLRSSHEPMPNFILKQQDVDDLAAYIMSLKQ